MTAIKQDSSWRADSFSLWWKVKLLLPLNYLHIFWWSCGYWPCISEDILLANETRFCLLLTSQAVTCFLCLALFSVNSKLVTVQEQLFVGDSDICLHQNFIPISKSDLLPRLRHLWDLQAWCHSHPAHAHGSPWREIYTSQKALELSLLQSSHWRLCHILSIVPSNMQRLCYFPLKGTFLP